MPDKRYKRKDGKRCARCWRNKLKHGNKNKKPKVKLILNNQVLIDNKGYRYRNSLNVNSKKMSMAKYRKKEFKRTNFVVRDPYTVSFTPSKCIIVEEYPDVYDKQKIKLVTNKYILDMEERKLNKWLTQQPKSNPLFFSILKN